MDIPFIRPWWFPINVLLVIPWSVFGWTLETLERIEETKLLRMSWGVIAIFCHNWLMTLLLPLEFHTAKNRCPATCITAIVTRNRSLFGILLRPRKINGLFLVLARVRFAQFSGKTKKKKQNFNLPIFCWNKWLKWVTNTSALILMKIRLLFFSAVLFVFFARARPYSKSFGLKTDHLFYEALAHP